MRVYNLQYPHNLQQNEMPATTLAIGYFDGVHRGHQEVIETAKHIAEQKGHSSGVMTFHPHPSVVLNKGQQTVHYITPIEDKLQQIEQLGIDYVYVVNFNETLAKLLPEQFVEHFLIQLNVQHVVAGFDFTYGFKGQGNMKTIKDHGKGQFTHTTVQKIAEGDEKISSSLIRNKIVKGEMEQASSLLGRPYRIKGKVVTGDQRGRTIGFPTANIDVLPDYIIPKMGVYAVGIKWKNNYYYGMANIGYKPTFQQFEDKPSIEVFIFDFSANLYNEMLHVDLYHFIREETKFNGVDQLVEQLHADESNIRRYILHLPKD
ncbi:bifunctional riboflavin kinase/FAD synthetase [Salirhabdus salicampi]|uniref:bifunctional riboflavin kinase/FAD synthetase n=1 Tax=Salirhabdus salicampi TaxID=476102 RepID=UPI0020C48231|nr:bifunctional riboflavin kinase/FAD synthetase [Salirhabdus salicampi]MCP8616478.1 bifunctional riboflavin kinase/FAD synthetase [Salirhabdus salicampi]